VKTTKTQAIENLMLFVSLWFMSLNKLWQRLPRLGVRPGLIAIVATGSEHCEDRSEKDFKKCHCHKNSPLFICQIDVSRDD
jgi:hypothetical protein